MAITFVGGVEGSAINGGNVVLSLTALTGGSDSAAATGDVVIVLGAMSGTQTVTLPAAYNLLVNGTSTKVGWKQMGATPDTSVTVTGSGSGTNSTAGIAFVYRGVDTKSLLATTASGTSTNPDPPAIDTITPNAVVIAGMRTAILDTSVTAPSGYAHQFDVAGDDNNDVTIGMSDRTIASPTSENPAAWTGVSSAVWASFSVRIHEAVPFFNESVVFPQPRLRPRLSEVSQWSVQTNLLLTTLLEQLPPFIPTMGSEFWQPVSRHAALTSQPSQYLFGSTLASAVHQAIFRIPLTVRHKTLNADLPARLAESTGWQNPLTTVLVGQGMYFYAPGQAPPVELPPVQPPASRVPAANAQAWVSATNLLVGTLAVPVGASSIDQRRQSSAQPVEQPPNLLTSTLGVEPVPFYGIADYRPAAAPDRQQFSVPNLLTATLAEPQAQPIFGASLDRPAPLPDRQQFSTPNLFSTTLASEVNKAVFRRALMGRHKTLNADLPARIARDNWQNPLTTILASPPAPMPFRGLAFEMPKRLPVRIQFEPMNLQLTTLQPRYMVHSWGVYVRPATRTPQLANPSINLLTSTLAPPPAVPFTPYDWPVPRRTPDNRGDMYQQSLVLKGQDQFFAAPGQGPSYDWPVPPRPPRAQVTDPVNLLANLYTQVEPKPFTPYDWPNPRRVPDNRADSYAQPINLKGQDQFFGGAGQPPAPYAWPQPTSRPAVQTWANTNLLPLLAAAAPAQPVGTQALPSQALAKSRQGEDFAPPNLLLTTLAMPFFGSSQEPPRLQSRQQPQQSANLLPQLLAPALPVGFAWDWSVPKPPQRTPQQVWQNTLLSLLGGTDQFFGPPGMPPTYDWPNPQPRRPTIQPQLDPVLPMYAALGVFPVPPRRRIKVKGRDRTAGVDGGAGRRIDVPARDTIGEI